MAAFVPYLARGSRVRFKPWFSSAGFFSLRKGTFYVFIKRSSFLAYPERVSSSSRELLRFSSGHLGCGFPILLFLYYHPAKTLSKLSNIEGGGVTGMHNEGGGSIIVSDAHQVISIVDWLICMIVIMGTMAL